MENRYYLAIDIGASSGRHILAHKKDGRIVLEEIYRFPNGMQEIDRSPLRQFARLRGDLSISKRNAGT